MINEIRRSLRCFIALIVVLGHPASCVGSFFFIELFHLYKSSDDIINYSRYVLLAFAWLIGYVRWEIFHKQVDSDISIWRTIKAFNEANAPSLFGLFSFALIFIYPKSQSMSFDFWLLMVALTGVFIVPFVFIRSRREIDKLNNSNEDIAD
jgi:hypothetical protein